jgi:hypothetical protein
MVGAVKKNWVRKNLPSGPRPGMFQTITSNLPEV